MRPGKTSGQPEVKRGFLMASIVQILVWWGWFNAFWFIEDQCLKQVIWCDLRTENPSFELIPADKLPKKLPVRYLSSLVVRASDCQCTSCNGPGFDPSIRRHSEGRQMKQCWILYWTKEKNPPKKYKKKKIKIFKISKEHIVNIRATVNVLCIYMYIHIVIGYVKYVYFLREAQDCPCTDRGTSLLGKT